MDRTKCPRCQHIGLVRAEHVIKGGNAVISFHCGSCDLVWELPDRRAAPRPVKGRGPKGARS